MKRIKLTFHPFTCTKTTAPMTEEEAAERYNRLQEAYAPNTGLFRVDLEIINA